MLSREGKKSAIIHSILFVVWVALLIVASFKDLEISKTISNGNSFIGAFFAVVAEWPAYFITPFATIILFYNVDRMTANKNGRIALKVLFALLHVGGWFLFFYGSEKLYENMPHEALFSLAYSIMLGVACLYFSKFIDKDFMHRMLKFAVFCIIILVVSRAIVTIIKVFWSRARFRDMLAHGSFDMFTPWYQPNGIRKVEGYKLTSFPSGHVTSAANLFVIVVLADILPSLKNKKTLLYIICSVFVGLTMIYRVVYNAHFFSDTLWAVLITYVIFYITKALFFKGGKFVYEDKTKAVEAPVDNMEEAEKTE